MSGEQRPIPWWKRTVTGRVPAKRRWGWKSTVGLILFIVMIDIGNTGQLTLYTGMILGGWVGFLKRVAADWRWSPSAFLTFGLCAGLLVAGAHLFLRHLGRALRPDAPWRLRWTLMLAMGVLVMFAAGIATVGIIHQTTWLARDGAFARGFPYRAQGAFHSLMKPDEASVPADEARRRIQSSLPAWRVVVIPLGGNAGAVIAGEENGLVPGVVVVGILNPTATEPRRRYAVTTHGKTTIAEQVALATSLISALPAIPKPAPPAP